MANKSKVIDHLERLNRKERSILLSYVLGRRTEGVFRLDPYFAGILANELDLEIPNDAFVAMDYHLDWIQMALCLANFKWQRGKVIPNPEIESGGRLLFQANQEDIDLLVAFEDRNRRTHLVLIEAKGVTSWDNTQLESKADRLRLIFGEAKLIGDIHPVVPHFILMSPNESANIRTEGWPEWMKAEKDRGYTWLRIPIRHDLIKVTRTDCDGHVDEDGDYVIVR